MKIHGRSDARNNLFDSQYQISNANIYVTVEYSDDKYVDPK